MKNHWIKQRKRRTQPVVYELWLEDPKGVPLGIYLGIRMGPNMAPNTINCVSTDPDYIAFVQRIVSNWTFTGIYQLHANGILNVIQDDNVVESWGLTDIFVTGYSLLNLNAEASLILTGSNMHTINSSYFKI